jgi:hypothetical protein
MLMLMLTLHACVGMKRLDTGRDATIVVDCTSMVHVCQRERKQDPRSEVLSFQKEGGKERWKSGERDDATTHLGDG